MPRRARPAQAAPHRDADRASQPADGDVPADRQEHERQRRADRGVGHEVVAGDDHDEARDHGVERAECADESMPRDVPDRVAGEDRPCDVHRRHRRELVGTLAARDRVWVRPVRTTGVDEAGEHAGRRHRHEQMDDEGDRGGRDERVAQDREDGGAAPPERERHDGQRQREVDEVVGVGRHERLRPVERRLETPFDVDPECRLGVEQPRRIAERCVLGLVREVPDRGVAEPEAGEQQGIGRGVETPETQPRVGDGGGRRVEGECHGSAR